MPDEEEGGFTAFALNYPGVISEGESIEEAKNNISEAFLALLESRRKHGEDMRYSAVVDFPKNSRLIWVSVNG